MWNTLYRESPRRWSGRVNIRLVEVATQLTPGRALDLGCGEGADAIWLAARDWQVVAVDISDEALRRAAEDAGELVSRIDFQHHDLTRSFPEGQFDLVSAQFLQSPLSWDRYALLRQAAGSVAAGGLFLLVDHGSGPPSSAHRHQGMDFPAPQEVLDGMALPDSQWQLVRAESVDREVVGPDGVPAVILDNVILLRRHG
ncbi:MAG: class I SAM-dependent methyltransferase [Mycobacterium sp.]